MGLRHKIASWLVRKELQADGRHLPFVPRWLSGKPLWTDWSAEKAIEDGLKASVWVYRCVNRRAKAVSSIPWYVEERKGDNWERIPNHPIEVLLAEPNPYMSGQDLIEYLVNHLDLSGNGIWHIVTAHGMPVEFWPIVPDPKIIKPIPDREKFISHYEITIDASDKRNVDPREIIHFKFVDPSNLYWGLSPLQVAARIVDTDVEAVKWNKVSLQNRAVSDGVFSFDHPLTDQQWREARKQVREQHQGADNARTPWVLGSGAKWHPMSLSPVEMDFLNSRKFSREEICAVFDVPTLLVGATDASTYNNYATARKVFWEDTVVPLLDDIREVLDMALVPYWDPEALIPGKQGKIRIMYDLSNVPALQENFADKVNNARTLWQMGVPLNMINQRLELGFEEIPGGDQPRTLGGFMFASGDGPRGKKSDVGGWTEEQKILFWKGREQDRQAWEIKVAEQVSRQFEEEGLLIAKAYEKNGEVGVVSAIDAQAVEWQGLLATIYTAIIEHFGQLEGERIANVIDGQKRSTGPSKRKFNFDPFEHLVRQFVIQQSARKVAYMTETTKKLIAQQIDEGVEHHETVPQIAKRIRDVYDLWASVGDSEIGYSRSMTIARTETGSAAGYGNFHGAVQAQVEFEVQIEKEWISSRDGDRVRESHQMLDGERVPLNQPYSNGLMYPGDPAGSPEEVISCRCVEAHHVVG